MSENLDYSQFETGTANDQDVLGQISKLADQLVKKDREIAEAEMVLKRLKKQREDIAESDLPELMISVGMSELKTLSGIPLKLEEMLFTSISEDRKPRAIAWLDAHGHGGIVKRNVVVGFNQCDQEKIDALLRLISKAWPNHKTELDVNANTVKALVKRLMKSGEDVDKDVFGIHIKNVVKIK
jgi:hypothetical protein